MELAGMEYVKTLVVTHPSMVEHMKKTQHADKECVVEVG